MRASIEGERRGRRTNPRDMLSKELSGALERVTDLPGLLEHDRGNLSTRLAFTLDTISIPNAKLLALTELQPRKFISLDDSVIAESIPEIDVNTINPIHKENPALMEIVDRAEAIMPTLADTLMNLRDAMGFFTALGTEDKDPDPESETESASVYLDRLRSRRMKIAPWCKFYNSTLLNENKDLTVNGIEFIVLMNMLKNAKSHNDGQKMPDGTDSTLEYEELTHDFTVTNMTGHSKKYDGLSIPELVSEGHYGKFISGVFSEMLGKKIEYPSDPTLFIATAKTAPLDLRTGEDPADCENIDPRITTF